jgi:hypothetical protein
VARLLRLWSKWPENSIASFTSGWEGRRRVDVCERPTRMVIEDLASYLARESGATPAPGHGSDSPADPGSGGARLR